jgi:hypothetical protein
MRSFLAGIALLLAFVTGTVALSAYVAETVLLDPSRAGEIVSKAIGQDAARKEILTRAVPGYDRLDSQTQALIDQAAGSEAARQAMKHVKLDDNGNVQLGPLRDRVVNELRAHGQGKLADRIRTQSGGAEISLPSKYRDKFQSARQTARDTWTKAGILTGILALIALVVSRRRIRTLGSIGITILLCCVAVALLALAVPGLVSAASSDPLAEAGASVLRSEWTSALSAMLPVAVVGAALTVLGLAGGRR